MNLYDMLLFRKLSGGGGGSSDFTTVEVTIKTDSMFANAVLVSIPFLVSEGGEEALVPARVFDTPDAEETLSVVLYKGQALAMPYTKTFELYGFVGVSGDITATEDGYLITGPGTITLYGGK